MQKKVKTGQGALVREFCRHAEKKITLFYSKGKRGVKSHSPSCANPWAQRPTALLLSAAPGWEAAEGRCNSLLLLIIVSVQIYFWKNHLGDAPESLEAVDKAILLTLFLGLEMSVPDLWHQDYFKSQLRFSLLNQTHNFIQISAQGRIHRAQDSSNNLAYILYQKRQFSTTGIA